MSKFLLISICFITAVSNAMAFSFDGSGPSDEVYDKIIEEIYSSQIQKPDENDQAIDSLIESIRNPVVDWRFRIKAIRILAQTKLPKAGEALLDMFYNSFAHSECPAIKSSIAIGLGNFPGETRIVNALIAGLEHPEVQIREACAYSLGLIGDVNSIPFLIESMKDASSAVRVTAIRSLARIGGNDIISYLKKIIAEEEDRRLKDEALRVLAQIR